jgi:hypothetical protein
LIRSRGRFVVLEGLIVLERFRANLSASPTGGGWIGWSWFWP